ERTEARFGIKPEWLVADTAYGAAPNLDWLVNTQGIAPHVPVIDKSAREDGTFSREDFIYDEAQDRYVCPAGKTLTTTGRVSRRRHAALPRECARLPCLPLEGPMLSQDPATQSHAQHSRARTGCCPGDSEASSFLTVAPRSQEGRNAVRTS